MSLLFTAKDFLRHTEVSLASQPADAHTHARTHARTHTHTHTHCLPIPPPCRATEEWQCLSQLVSLSSWFCCILLSHLWGKGEGCTQYCAWLHRVMFLSPAPSSFGPSMLLGFYSIPGLKALLPRKHGTPLATVSHRQASILCPSPPHLTPPHLAPSLITAAPGQLWRVAGVWVSSAPPPQHTGPHSIQATRQLPLLPLAGQCCSASGLQLCL